MANLNKTITEAIKEYTDFHDWASDQARKVMGIWQFGEVVRKTKLDSTEERVFNLLIHSLREFREVRQDIKESAEKEISDLNRLITHMENMKAGYSAYLGGSRVNEYIAKEKHIIEKINDVAFLIDLDQDTVFALLQIANNEVFVK
jgi:hypothetical protein